MGGEVKGAGWTEGEGGPRLHGYFTPVVQAAGGPVF